ncbi:IS200/IS605 family transposase [Azospirillum sp. TSO35-2]|uniref:IS200/IS605 family transposase n=1 Tax=Azospirillum sp. TSO35-2 TaxID=716796 RepID=UPI000D6119F8|nr:IS200/IS605 family transposase [Azospirillum sp. TSO35-2]PWC40146.1 transposase [Azospirillum sp. TSO35-2]
MSEQIEFSKPYHWAYALHDHLVLVTKHRRRGLTAARCEGWGGKLLGMNGEPDPFLLLIARLPNLDLPNVLNNLKTTTSRLVRKEFADHLASVYRKPVFWSRSSCIVSCGGVPLSIIKPYIEQQQRPE